MATAVAKRVCTCVIRNYWKFPSILALRNSVLTRRLEVRHHARWFAPFLFALNNQVKAIERKFGPEDLKPRSHQENWDYDSEVYALSKRLGEELDDATLKTALTDESYLKAEEAKRVEMGVTGEAAKLEIEDNQALAQIGRVFASEYTKAYLRQVYPRLPEAAISDIHGHVDTEDMYAHVGRHLGLTDVVMCPTYPVPNDVAATAFLALIGAIIQDGDAAKGGLFVRDFLLSQLMDKDFSELYRVINPMGKLIDILKEEGRAPPEARLLRQVGVTTIMPVYMVGIYSDKTLLGWGSGESLNVAEEEAAHVALKQFYQTADNGTPLPLDWSTSGHLNDVVCREIQGDRLLDQSSS